MESVVFAHQTPDGIAVVGGEHAKFFSMTHSSGFAACTFFRIQLRHSVSFMLVR